MRLRAVVAVAVVGTILSACSDATAPPLPLRGVFLLMEENGRALPADPFEPTGCCLTIYGLLTFRDSTYEMKSAYRDKQSDFSFFNSESGRYVRSGSAISFDRSSGGGLSLPYRITSASVSKDGRTVIVTYGDDPANVIRATFRRCDACVVE
jgi:hypothetical protein